MEVSAITPPYWLLEPANDFLQRFKVIMVSHSEQQSSVVKLETIIQQADIVIQSRKAISNKITEYSIDVCSQQAWQLFKQCLELQEQIDTIVIPEQGRTKKLLLCDMDSTIVNSESLDDVAARVGIGEQVQRITSSAMRGELDFRQALEQRVALLNGVTESVLDQVAESLQFNQGAESLIRIAKQHGIRTVLISGGFDPIVDTVADRLGFDRHVCNQLQIVEQRLSGKVLPPIVDSETKHAVLLQECRALGIEVNDACAVGDGANDISMLQTAGLGIAYQGKLKVREATAYHINSGNLESALAFMGLISK